MGMLADPELLNKVAAGQSSRVRKCISCENCIDAMEQRFSVDCAVSPRAGSVVVLVASIPSVSSAVRSATYASWSRKLSESVLASREPV